MGLRGDLRIRFHPDLLRHTLVFTVKALSFSASRTILEKPNISI